MHRHVRQNEDLWVVRVGRDDGNLRPWHYINVYSQSGVITTLRIYPWHPSIDHVVGIAYMLPGSVQKLRGAIR